MHISALDSSSSKLVGSTGHEGSFVRRDSAVRRCPPRQGGGGDMTPRILVTQLVPQPAIDLLRQVGEVEVNPDPDHILTKAELMAALRRNDHLFCLLTNSIDAQ